MPKEPQDKAPGGNKHQQSGKTSQDAKEKKDASQAKGGPQNRFQPKGNSQIQPQMAASSRLQGRRTGTVVQSKLHKKESTDGALATERHLNTYTKDDS